MVWEFFTNPKYRAILYGSDKQELKDLKKGRVENGSVYVCSHGKNRVDQTIVDWHPFEQYTIRNRMPGGGFVLTTICFKAERYGTLVSILAGKVTEGPLLLRGILDRVGSRVFLATMQEGFEAMSDLVGRETAGSSPFSGDKVDIQADQIEDALSQSLSGA